MRLILLCHWVISQVAPNEYVTRTCPLLPLVKLDKGAYFYIMLLNTPTSYMYPYVVFYAFLIFTITLSQNLLYWCFTAIPNFFGHFGPGQLTYPHCSWAGLVHILSPVTGNYPSWISGRERKALEIISWPNSTKECCRTWGSNPQSLHYHKLLVSLFVMMKSLENVYILILKLPPTTWPICKIILNHYPRYKAKSLLLEKWVLTSIR